MLEQFSGNLDSKTPFVGSHHNAVQTDFAHPGDEHSKAILRNSGEWTLSQLHLSSSECINIGFVHLSFVEMIIRHEALRISICAMESVEEDSINRDGIFYQILAAQGRHRHVSVICKAATGVLNRKEKDKILNKEEE